MKEEQTDKENSKEKEAAPKRKDATPAERRKRMFTLVKGLILLILIVGVPVYILVWRHDLITDMSSLKDVLRYLKHFDSGRGAVIYLVLEVLQIVISVLPGQVFQIAAGMVLGVPMGLLLSIVGAVMGTTIVYFIARGLGEEAMKLVLGPERSEKLIRAFNSERSYMTIFLIYLIPGMPKDLMAYAAGISNVRFRAFLILSTVGRIPAMTISLLFGRMILAGNRTALITIAVLVAVGIVLLLIFRKPLMELADKIYVRLTQSPDPVTDADSGGED